MQGPVAAYLDGGARLHLQHGPIDLIIGAEGDARRPAFDAAIRRFQTILEELVEELPLLRSPVWPIPEGKVAQRMVRAALPFAADEVTPMIAVAGSVADEILQAMRAAGPLRRAYVNNGGDIALHLAPEEQFRIAMASDRAEGLGHVDLSHGIGGLATSGAGGRSFSLGIAGSVTVLAASAAEADAAATLIANAVDLPGHPAITRQPACDLDPDSDLGDRLVVTGVGALDHAARQAALLRGLERATEMRAMEQIIGAALFLQGSSVMTEEFAGALTAPAHV